MQLDRPGAGQQLVGKVSRPAEQARSWNDAALQDSLVDGEQQLGLKIEVAGKSFLHHGGQLVEPVRRRIAGDVPEVGGQLPGTKPGISEAGQQQRAGKRRVDAKRHTHQLAEISGMILEVSEPGRIVDGVEVVAERNSQRVPEVLVAGRHLSQRGKQRADVAGTGAPRDGISGGAANLWRVVAQAGENHRPDFRTPVFLRGGDAPCVDAYQLGLVVGHAQQGSVLQLAKAVQHPRAVRLQLRLGISPGHRLAKRLGGTLPNVIGEVVGRSHAPGEQRVGQLGERLAKRLGGQVDRLGQALGFRPPVDQPPDAAHLAVAPGVVEPDLVVADNAVVKIGNVQRAVRAELQVDRPEPRVARADQVRHLDALGAAAAPVDLVAIDAAGHDVADENVVAKLRRPVGGAVEHDAAQAGGVVVVSDYQRPEADAVVRLAEARVIGIADKLVNRRTVAVGRVKVAE